MGNFIFDKNLYNKFFVFNERKDAGKKLAQFLKDKLEEKGILVFAVPSGGVPVAKEISKELKAPLDLLIVRKIQLPWNTEAGFGAMNLDKDVVLNEELIKSLNLSQEDIEKQKEKTWKTLIERNKIFRNNKPFPDIKGKTVVIVDDGLASGYTLRAAIKFLKKREPKKIIVAVPTCSKHSAEEISQFVDEIYCLNVRDIYPFAVADAYKEWHDLSADEVIEILNN